jgi:hypothetical protein
MNPPPILFDFDMNPPPIWGVDCDVTVEWCNERDDARVVVT